MAAFASPFLVARLGAARLQPAKCARAPAHRAPVRASADWEIFGSMYHNEGSTWSGQGDMWVTVSTAVPDIMNFEAGEEDTVTYGENTVFGSDLCDVSGENCAEGGGVPADAMKPIGKEVKTQKETTETKGRVIVSYSKSSSVFKDDDSIAK